MQISVAVLRHLICISLSTPLKTLSCSRAASALVCSLHVADVPEEFVTELAGFCNVCLSKESRGRLFCVGDEGGNKTRR